MPRHLPWVWYFSMSSLIDLKDEMESILNKFVGQLSGAADPLEDGLRIQNDFNKLEKWSEINCMEFSADKCNIEQTNAQI